MFGKYVDPPNPFASRVYRKEPEEPEVPEISDKPAQPVVEPAMTNAKTARAPVVETKKKYHKRRLPGERLLRRVARIEPKDDDGDNSGESDIDEETLQNIHGALGDIVERMRI